MRRLVLGLLLPALLLAVALCDRAQVMGDAAPLPEAQRAAVLSCARGALRRLAQGRGEGAPTLSCPGAPEGAVAGVILTLWPPGAPPLRGSWGGDGARLPDALLRAAEPLAQEARAAEGRLQVDLVTEVKALPWPASLIGPWLIHPGLDGLWIGEGEGARLLPPEDLMAYGGDVAAWLGAAGGAGPISRLRAVSQVEAAPGGPGALALRRGQPPVSWGGVPALEEASRAAAAFLARSIGDDGRFCYTWDAFNGRCGKGYNMLRHAGSAFSLAQAWGRFRDPTWLPPLDRALDALLASSQVEGEGGDTRRFIVDGKEAKLGGTGLALLALAEHARLTGDRRRLPEMEALARFIVSQQREDGFLPSWYAWEGDRDIPETHSIYYPGEATFGLTRLYRLTGDARWLDAARRAADFLVERRWRFLGTELMVPPDAWLAQALADLLEVAPDPEYEAYVYAIADAVDALQIHPGEASPELVGGPITGPGLPLSAVSGGRSEAITAAWRVAVRAGRAERAASLAISAHALAAFGLRAQLREGAVGVADAARALGGVPELPGGRSLRNDYTQHVLSGWLGVLQAVDLGGAPP